MKTKIIIIFFCVATSFNLFAAGTDAASFDSAKVLSKLDAAYESGFYPGAVRFADELLEFNPNSIFAAKALACKGECLYHMGRVEESAAALEQAVILSKSDDELLASNFYWLGRAQYERHDYEKANKSFYSSAEHSVLLNGNKKNYYFYSVLYGARTNIKLNKNTDALPLFEYVISNGNKYSSDDYEDSVLELLSLYNSLGQYEKTEQICARFEKIFSSNKTDGSEFVFSKETSGALTLYKGDAQNCLGKYKDAYDSYTKVITDGTPSLAVTALQRAYVVSSEHRKEVGAEPGSVVARTENQFAMYPEFIAEFRTRLAIDAYNSGGYEKSVSYFDDAAPDANRELLLLASFYRAEIVVKNEKKSINSATEVSDKILSDTAATLKLVPSDKLYTVYNAFRARYSAISGDWNKCISFSKAALEPEPPAVLLERSAAFSVRYWKALAYYEINNYLECISTLEPLHPVELAEKSKSDEEVSVCVLYARAIAKIGRTSDADKIFYQLSKNGVLSNDGHLDYAKTLLIGGHLISAAEQTGFATGAESYYLSALALFNRRKWEDAAAEFEKCISSNDIDSKYKTFAQFYLGYAQYREGGYKKAYNTLTKFISEEPSNQLVFTARIVAVKSAVQLGRYSDAFPIINDAVKTAPSEQSAHEALLLGAGVYADSGKYDEALSLLSSYNTSHSDFGIQCRYQSAQIYVQKNDYNSADKIYASLVSEKSSNPLVEESFYRRGELAYTTEKYDSAIPLFELYKSTYPNGRFYDAALFFSADSLSKCGYSDKAILMYLQLAKSEKENTYRYGAIKNIINLYESSGDYLDAVSYANILLSEYSTQARADGIESKLKELRLLDKGEDSKIVKKQSEYENAGGMKTESGRAICTELVELYASSPSLNKKAIPLAEQLLSKQKENLKSEYKYAARTANVLGYVYRSQNINKSSAEDYLLAAEYFRMDNNNDKAAKALYGAVEAFDAAGMYGDSKAASETLNSLYPDSSLAHSASVIVNK